ncbi:MAG: isocitrate/isopropylmalate dehydrogenase family protein [Promethearchaeota archaeon]|nr:MAG: isocitrate/isopropylmalate dehydrogenase family protein [Candidatus Lokiarchaeota archaeon]
MENTKYEIYQTIQKAREHIAKLVMEQLDRIELMKKEANFMDFSNLKKVIVGIVPGDGIGPEITKNAKSILEFLLKDEIKSGAIELRDIEGLTIENRVKVMKAIPDDVLAEIKKCHVILKGPTMTPRKGDPWPNIESANVAMRRYLDLFANVRPVRVPHLGIDWMFFRENTEGAYVLGSKGLIVNEDLSLDFTAVTKQGSERIIRAGFDYAKKNHINRVSIVTKANVIKTTDGMFLNIAARIANEYPEIEWDDWYVDIMTAKLIDPARQKHFRVIIAPNLYGDILTDQAGQIQGGVGTAGSANIGKNYAMFEAIHGTADKMIAEGRGKYADPSSIIKAAALLLNHIGYSEKAKKLEMALEICAQYERKVKITGRDTGVTGSVYAKYIMDTITDPKLEEKYQSYQ